VQHLFGDLQVESEPLPHYALHARAGDAEWRGETPTNQVLRSDSLMEIVLTPDHPAGDVRPRYAPDGRGIVFGMSHDPHFYADRVRLMRFERHGVRILVDYAHNPEGLRGLLAVAEHLRGDRGRLGLLLGHAGNRQDAELEALAAVAAEFHPALIVVKENEAHLRGRGPGEVPRLIYSALLRAGVARSALQMRMSELEAVQAALAWAQPGDVLALPVHATAARAAVLALLNEPP